MNVISPSNAPTFNPKQTVEQRQEQQQLALLQRIVRKFYFFHLIFIALVYVYLLFGQKHFKHSFTFVLLTVYCSMVVWNWLVNFFLVSLGFDNVAVVFNRVIIRFFIMLFCPLGLAAIIIDNYHGITVVLLLILYMSFISFLFFVYQIYGCTVGQPKNPKYIFEPIDLHAETQKVWEIRRQFNRDILTHRNFAVLK